MQLYFTITAPHQWVKLDHKRVTDSGVSEGLQELPLHDQYDRIVAVAPGEDIITRSITLPIRNHQKLLTAIPYAIEDSLIAPVDALHFSILDVGRDGQSFFAYVSKSTIENWLESFRQSGLRVDAILPDYLLLPMPSPGSVVLVQAADDRILIRSGRYQGAVIDAAMLPAWLHEQDEAIVMQADNDTLAGMLASAGANNVEVLPTGNGLPDWLREGIADDMPGLLQGDYQADDSGKGAGAFRVIAAMILLAVLAKFTGDVIELNWLSRTHARLEQKTVAIFHDLFPGARLIPGKARVQMKSRLEGLSRQNSRDEFARLLVATARQLNAAGVRIEELQYRDGALTVVCTMRDFAHLDRVKQALQKNASIDVRLLQSGAKGSKVQARFEITGRPV